MKVSVLSILFFCCTIFLLSSQEKLKDTLFFELDGKYVFQSKYVSNSYLIKDSSDISNGTFFFEKCATLDNLKPDKVFCLKKIVRTSKFYNKRRKVRLDDDGLFEYFSNYIIFLVKKNKKANQYILVRANWEIE